MNNASMETESSHRQSSHRPRRPRWVLESEDGRRKVETDLLPLTPRMRAWSEEVRAAAIAAIAEKHDPQNAWSNFDAVVTAVVNSLGHVGSFWNFVAHFGFAVKAQDRGFSDEGDRGGNCYFTATRAKPVLRIDDDEEDIASALMFGVGACVSMWLVEEFNVAKYTPTRRVDELGLSDRHMESLYSPWRDHQIHHLLGRAIAEEAGFDLGVFDEEEAPVDAPTSIGWLSAYATEFARCVHFAADATSPSISSAAARETA